MKEYPTYREAEELAKKHGISYVDRQNTKWSKEIVAKCKHKWEPVQMIIKEGMVQPDLVNARTFCICRKCCSHTYILTGWVGYFLGSPDELEDPDEG